MRAPRAKILFFTSKYGFYYKIQFFWENTVFGITEYSFWFPEVGRSGDHFSVSFFVRPLHNIYFIVKQLKYILYHENHQNLLGIWWFKYFQGAEFLGPNHFQERVLSKNDTFFKIFIWDANFSHLLLNLKLALKFQISDKKANISD